jgi:YebC/PmpR family DNA-binding regulatory protein
MAGHSHFANIKHKKAARDAKKAKIFTKAAREIAIAAKNGTDVNFNAALRVAISKARAVNLPKDRIETAIKSHDSVDTNYDYIRYNAFLGGGIALIIECETNNKNRTIMEVRYALSKNDGNIVDGGGVEFMFSRIGRIVYEGLTLEEDKVFETALEAGANNVEVEEDVVLIETDYSNLHDIANILCEKLGNASSVEVFWKANNYINIADEAALEGAEKCIAALEELDDVDNVFSNALNLL